MNRQGNTVQISPERLRLFCSKNGGQTAVSETLGYGKSFISNALHSGKMSRAANKLLAATYGIPENFFLAPDPPKTAQPPEPKAAPQAAPQAKQMGYALRLQATDKQVFLLLEHDGEKVGSAYSKRKDSSELALTQAISYVAHMIYKFCEQKTLQESMEGK